MRRYLLLGERRAQLKMLETVGILLAFFFLFGIGMKFYGTYQLRGLEQAKNEFTTLDAVKLTNQVVASSLLRCSEDSIDQGQCIDEYKVRSLIYLFNASNDNLPNIVAYRNSVIEQLGQARLVLHYLYPAVDLNVDAENVTLYDVLPPLTNQTQVFVAQLPVFVSDKIKQKNVLAMLEVTLYG